MLRASYQGHRRVAVSVICAALTVVVQLQAQRNESQDAYIRSYGILRALYPDLNGQGVLFMVSADRWLPYDVGPRPFIALTVTLGKPSSREHEYKVTPILKANIEFTVYGEVGTLNVEGEYVNSKKNWDLEMLAEKEADAPPEKVAARLQSLGVKFGVGKDREMREEALVQLRRLDKVLGKVELKDLQLLDNGTVWRAEILVASPHGPRKYAVLFEPFEGRLKSMGGLNS